MLKLTKCREIRTKQANKNSKLRLFNQGDSVLYRVPGLASKLIGIALGPAVA